VSFIFIGASFTASLALVWVLRAFPNSADEYVFLFGADTFLAGRLWNPLPPLHQCFSFLHIAEIDGKWVSQYAPGWSMLLAVARFGHLSYWLVCPLVGIVLLFTVFKLGRRQNGRLGRVLAVVLIALSPFFVVNAASYFNAIPTATAGALFCWEAVEFFDAPKFRNAFLAGAALGCVGILRPYDIVVFAVPFIVGLIQSGRRLHYAFLPLIGLGGLPFLALLLLYDRAITGSAFLLTEIWANTPAQLGFYLFDYGSTPLLLLSFTPWNIIDIGRWSSPLLLFAYPVALAWKLRKHQWSFVDLIFPANVAAYLLLEGVGGSRYGPHYYLISYPEFALTLLSLLVPMLKDGSRPKRTAFASALVICHLVVCVIGIVMLGASCRNVVDERMDMYDQVQALRVHDAVVIVHSVHRFTPMDLTRNGISIGDEDVIYALDIPDRMATLRRLFPTRSFYIYSAGPGTSKGQLKLM
jgi:hypothetical protein